MCDGKANPDRLGRNNVSFFPLAKLDWVNQWMKKEIPLNKQVVQFPSIRDEIGGDLVLSASKWPKTKVEVLFDLRDANTKAEHIDNKPCNTLSTENFLWGDPRSRPQLAYKSEVLMANFQSSVHYLKKHKQVLHISTVSPFEEENDVATGQFNIVY